MNLPQAPECKISVTVLALKGRSGEKNIMHTKNMDVQVTTHQRLPQKDWDKNYYTIGQKGK